MEEPNTIEGTLKYIGAPKAFGKLWSIGLKTDADDRFHNIAEFSEERVKAILGTAKIGDKVVLTEQKIKGYWNVKSVKFLEQVNAEIQGMNTLDTFNNPTEVREFMDEMKPLGNLYHMAEEKLNALIEQNALIQTKLDNTIDLLMKLAKKAEIDLDSFKPASQD